MIWRERVGRWGLGLILWIGANVIAWSFLERNELQSRAEQNGVPYDVAKLFEERVSTITDASGRVAGQLRYQLYDPSWPVDGRLHPVILYLHGSGSRGNDNLQQLAGVPARLTEPTVRKEFPCIIVAPQCPEGVHWSKREFPDHDDTIDCLDLVTRALDDVLAQYPADPSRVYLMGYSMGGFGSWELAAREPTRFAMVIPIAGGGNPDWAPRLANVPIRAVHGDADAVVSVDQSREMIHAIRAAGGAPMYDEIRGGEHSVWVDLLSEPAEFMRWLFSHHRARGVSEN